MKKRNYILILIFIFILAFLFRFIDLSNLPAGLNQDEAVNGVDAFYLANFGRDHHGNLAGPFLRSFNDWVSPILTYSTIPMVKFFGLNIFNVRFVTVIYGMMTLITTFFISKSLKLSKESSILTLSMVAFSPVFIHLSRWAIPPSIVPFWLSLLILTQIYTFKFSKYKKFTSLVLSSLVAAVLTYSYPTMKLFVPLYYFGFCLLILVQSMKFKRFKIKKIIWPLIKSSYPYILFLIVVSPIYILTIVNPSKYNARFDDTAITATGQNPFFGFVIRYISYFLPFFLFTPSDPNNMHRPSYFGLLNIGFLVLYCIVFYQLFKHRDLIIKFIKKELGKLKEHSFLYFKTKGYEFYVYAMFVCGIILSPVAASITKDYFMTLRSVHFLYLGVICFGIYLNKLLKVERLRLKIIWSISGLLILNSVLFGWVYASVYPEISSKGFKYGNQEILEYFNQNNNQYNKGYIDMMQIYEFFYYTPDLKDINQEKQELIKNKNYEFKTVNLEEFSNLLVIHEVSYNDTLLWRVYQSSEDGDTVWLAKRVY